MVQSPWRSQTARLMLGASALTTLGAIPPFLVGAQAVLMQRDLHFGPSVLGLVVSTFFAVAALATILGGKLLESWTRRQGQLTSGILVALGGFGLAFGVHRWEVLIVVMAALGLANAACQGTANQTVATVLPAHRRGLGFGIKQSAVPAAIMFGGLAVPTMTAVFGWRSTFLVTGCAGLVVIVRALLQPRAALPRAPRGGFVGGAVDRAPWAPLLLCGVAITFASAAANFLGAYLASWAYDVGLSVGQAGLLMAAGSGSSILIRIFAGHRADRRYGGNLAVVAAQMAAGAVCLALIGLAVPWVLIVFGFLAFGLGWSWPGLFLYAVARVGRDAPTRATSVVQAGAFTGGALGPVLLGLVVSGVGFQGAWWAAAGSFVMAATLTMVARAGFRRDLVRRPPATPFGYGGGVRQPNLVARLGDEAVEDDGSDSGTGR